MADTKLSNLTALTAPATGDFMEVLDVSDTSMAAAGTNKKMTLANLLAGLSIYSAGGTDVAVADGGTGSSTASAARTALGVAVGSDVQAWDADLDTLAASQISWTTWTPAWTNVTVGNATQVNDYTQIGKTAIVRLLLTWGSTTSASGIAAVGGFPNMDTTIASANIFGLGRATVGGTTYPITVAYSTTSLVTFKVTAYNPALTVNPSYASQGNVTNAIPGTWTTGDILQAQFFYRAA